MQVDLIIDWLQASLRWGAPLILVSVGEVFSERAGIINLGLEGIMLFGALLGVVISFFTGSVFLGGKRHHPPRVFARDGVRLPDGVTQDKSCRYGAYVQSRGAWRNEPPFRHDLRDPVCEGQHVPPAVSRKLRRLPVHRPDTLQTAGDYLGRIRPPLHCGLGALPNDLGPECAGCRRKPAGNRDRRSAGDWNKISGGNIERNIRSPWRMRIDSQRSRVLCFRWHDRGTRICRSCRGYRRWLGSVEDSIGMSGFRRGGRRSIEDADRGFSHPLSVLPDAAVSDYDSRACRPGGTAFETTQDLG